jgi:hypothetical protein
LNAPAKGRPAGAALLHTRLDVRRGLVMRRAWWISAGSVMRRVLDAAGASHAAIQVLSMRQSTRCSCSNPSVAHAAIHALDDGAEMLVRQRARCSHGRWLRVQGSAIGARGLELRFLARRFERCPCSNPSVGGRMRFPSSRPDAQTRKQTGGPRGSPVCGHRKMFHQPPPHRTSTPTPSNAPAPTRSSPFASPNRVSACAARWGPCGRGHCKLFHPSPLAIEAARTQTAPAPVDERQRSTAGQSPAGAVT